MRPTQQIEQVNCLNSPADGCLPRPCAEFYALPRSFPRSELPTADNHFYTEFRRSNEDYLLEVDQLGTIYIYNLTTGALVATDTSKAAYLSSADPRTTIGSQMVGDYLFLLNRTKVVSMSSLVNTKSPKRPNEGVVFIRGGAYSAKYSVSIKHSTGTVYTYSYQTPDNSATANANYVNTDHIATALYRAMTGGVTTTVKNPTGGTIYPDTVGSLGQSFQGTSGASVGATDLTTLGYSLHINGSSIHIWHDTLAFTLDSDTGFQAGTNLVSFQQDVTSFSRLPNNGFKDYVVKVGGSTTSTADDYYVKCNNTGSSAVWVETVAPDTFTQLDASTLPVTVRIDNLNTFSFITPTWSGRVVGDAKSDPDPTFVGQNIKDIFFSDGRLGFLTDDSVVWSKLDNPYAFFRTSVQLILDNDPISFLVNGNSNTAVLERAFMYGSLVALWAQTQQFVVKSLDSQFSSKNISIKPSTAYDFVETTAPVSAGQGFYFLSAEDALSGQKAYSIIRELKYTEGKFTGESEITAHVPRLLPNDITMLACSDLKKMVVCFSPSFPTRLFVYNFFNEGNERTQSAWQVWDFNKCGERIQWFGFFKSKLRILFRSNGLNSATTTNLRLCALSLSYLSSSSILPLPRLDVRVSNQQCTFVSYDASLDETTLTVPQGFLQDTVTIIPGYNDIGGAGTNISDDTPTMSLVLTSGTVVKVKRRIDATTLVFAGDIRISQPFIGIPRPRILPPFYLGWAYKAYVRPSLPTVKDGSGEVLLHDAMTIETIRVAMKDTVSSYIEIIQGDGTPNIYPFSSQSTLGSLSLASGVLKAPVRERDTTKFELRIVNDTPFPSAWQYGEWTADVTLHEGNNGQTG